MILDNYFSTLNAISKMIKKKISKNFTTKIRKESFLFKTIKQFHIKKILIIDKLSKVYPHPPFFLLPFSSSREKSKRINRRQERTNSKKNFLEKRFLDLSARDIVFQNSSQLLAMCACVCVLASRRFTLITVYHSRSKTSRS